LTSAAIGDGLNRICDVVIWLMSANAILQQLASLLRVPAVESLVRPPTFGSDTFGFCEDLIHRLSERVDTLPCINSLEESPDKRFVGFYEAKKSVLVLLVVTTADP
jgi:hypothetical protein